MDESQSSKATSERSLRIVEKSVQRRLEQYIIIYVKKVTNELFTIYWLNRKALFTLEDKNSLNRIQFYEILLR